MMIDLASYLKRIDYSGTASPSLETLSALHLQHTETIPFENLNPLLGWPVRLDAASLQQKLVHDRRGGYCYEQNLFFKHVLDTIGFRTAGLAARVVWNMPEDVVLPRTHMLLHIDLDGTSYIGDTGFGGLTLTAPLRLQSGIEQSTPHGSFRLETAGEEFVLQAKLGVDWKPLYRFTLQEQLLPDYEMANYYVSCHPRSRFVSALIAARPARDRRYALLNNELTIHYLTGETERRRLTTVSELRGVLQDAMRLEVPAAPEVDAALQKLAGNG